VQHEPVVYMWDSERKDIDAPGYYRPEHLFFAENSVKRWGGRVVPLYTAPPAPAVPDISALTDLIVDRLIDCSAADDDSIADAETFVYNACRAAMLDGSGLMWSGFDPAKDSSDAIPDGWKLVPVCPTEDMLAAGRTLNDSQLNMTPRNRIEMVYRAMLAAAPTQGEKQ